MGGHTYQAPTGVAVNCVRATASKLFVGGTKGFLAAWDVVTHTQVAVFGGHGLAAVITCMAVLPNGQICTGDASGVIIAHDTQCGGVVRRITGHGSEVTWLDVFHSDSPAVDLGNVLWG